ncbi:helix-turn-helix transcriptional regulator [Streptomyces sp. NPDC091972]|uniref:helix-turn-helix transcriptional regulator n=1 Tax=Streptomyces sp. NPDC091972 TaxID=3366007 RepID=UPI0038300907
MINKSGPLGEYLRARRAVLQPQKLGFGVAERRRVPGLRRQEIAQLAGISLEYYVRLEQGRERHPSEQVVDSLARGLQLDAAATAHLHRLASMPRHQTMRQPLEVVPPGIRQLISGWTANPAFVIGKFGDIHVANSLAEALCPSYQAGRNLFRDAFLDPEVRSFYTEWEAFTGALVAGLRSLAVPPHLGNPHLQSLVSDLSAGSERFRSLWERHDVRGQTGGTFHISHPAVGSLELFVEKLAVTGSDGLTLMIYHAEPGSPSAKGLSLLAAAAATTTIPQ